MHNLIKERMKRKNNLRLQVAKETKNIPNIFNNKFCRSAYPRCELVCSLSGFTQTHTSTHTLNASIRFFFFLANNEINLYI